MSTLHWYPLLSWSKQRAAFVSGIPWLELESSVIFLTIQRQERTNLYEVTKPLSRSSLKSGLGIRPKQLRCLGLGSRGGRTKDDILRRAFLSLIELRERMDVDPPPSSMTSSVVASCESSSSSSSSKQRTLDSYNLLDDGRRHDGPSSSTADDKPAEWTDRIDLAKRRDEFGKMISPLSCTTRFERWGMACRRVLTLTCLAAPLGEADGRHREEVPGHGIGRRNVLQGHGKDLYRRRR
jgi:hypothetical protein